MLQRVVLFVISIVIFLLFLLCILCFSIRLFLQFLLLALLLFLLPHLLRFLFSFPFSPALPSSLLPSSHSFPSPPVLSPLLPCPPLFSPPLPSSHSFTSPLVLSSPLLRIIRRANSLFVLLFLPKLSFVNLLFTSSFFILSAARIYTYQSFLALRLSISLLLLFLSLLFCLSSSISPFVFLSSFCAPLPQHSSLLLLYFRIFFLYPPCSYSSNPLIDIFLILSISNFHALTSSIT